MTTDKILYGKPGLVNLSSQHSLANSCQGGDQVADDSCNDGNGALETCPAGFNVSADPTCSGFGGSASGGGCAEGIGASCTTGDSAGT